MRHVDHLASIAAEFDGTIVDLWGVVHDGLTPYPGAIDCLQRLRAAGKRVVLLSNAPRRVGLVQDGLRRMGLPDDSYDGILTSGEATRSLLEQRTDPWIAGMGRRVLHLGPEKDANLYQGLELEIVTDPAGADLLLNTGPDDDALENGAAEDVLDVHMPLLRACAAVGLPMLCANPDLEIVRGGKRIVCAGLLASLYAQFGGTVRSIGKPHPEVYEQVRTMLGVPLDRVLAIGDALATDIAGAKAAGIASCWVLGGIHAELIGGDNDLAEAEARSAGLAPVATIPSLLW
ncbi:TIGR01459 family HAD-type hydrolase [Lichenicoccus sp.]|uniref:TIGR01459 family HAD-type hydrolase n=1 Tax=Lichenicoccus sp. TaxID=2781899 RepID=UPI003D115F5B